MVVRVVAGVIGALLLLGVVVLYRGLPEGSRSLSGAVPDDAEILLRQDHEDVVVLLLGRDGDLQLMVAYRERNRWRSIEVRPAPRTADAAWAATSGAGRVPAFAAVYGRLEEGTVTIRWQDGHVDENVEPERGVYLVLRDGSVRPEGVDVIPPADPPPEAEGEAEVPAEGAPAPAPEPEPVPQA